MKNLPAEDFYTLEAGVLAFQKELDIKAVEALTYKKAPLVKQLLASETKTFTLDFSKVQIVDTSGLAYVLDLINTLEQAGKEVKLTKVEALSSLVELYNVEQIIFAKQRLVA